MSPVWLDSDTVINSTTDLSATLAATTERCKVLLSLADASHAESLVPSIDSN